jgi:hypothetical protein
MKIPSWWPHNEALANERDLELERVTGRLGILTKRVEQLELQFGNMYDDMCNWIGRIRDLERQLLWMDVPSEKPGSLDDVEEYHKAKLKAWLAVNAVQAANDEDKAEAIRRTIRFVRGENNANKRTKKKGKKK